MKITSKGLSKVRAYIGRATAEFAKQFKAPKKSVKLSKRDQAIVKVFTDDTDAFDCQRENVLALVNALTGKDFSKLVGEEAEEVEVRYPRGTAFVSLNTGNGNNYKVGEVALNVSSDETGEGSMMLNGDTGNCPPEYTHSVRPATKKEIAALPDSVLEKFADVAGLLII